ncbi:hypothetical protein GWK08_14855 [Leptobacterium flavescens]|uniref:Uncharacterized protein n=1 Tax=Leptobacterium flavescens TaxID=472055 RepID=A0A6P0UN75_9FLAO|nr:hypothetical protein [Leptobacterium flavescens]NER14734.1 hypothetical protein [Leptobacterium flavescens]
MKKILCLVAILFISFNLSATPTKITVRVKAKDAKFIGNSMGGAHIIIRDKISGEILSQGKTTGGTGNTGLIMNTPRERGMRISDDGTSGYIAELDIDEPLLVRIEVLAPFNKKQASVAASTEIWVLPGKDILGDGIVLEIPGFVIDILNPRTHQFISLKSLKDGIIEVKANVVMMCGCTISDGGLWDANKMEVKGILKRNGKALGEIDLNIKEPNLFAGNFKVDGGGVYELIVYAYNPESGNTGVDKINYIINE